MRPELAIMLMALIIPVKMGELLAKVLCLDTKDILPLIRKIRTDEDSELSEWLQAMFRCV